MIYKIYFIHFMYSDLSVTLINDYSFYNDPDLYLILTTTVTCLSLAMFECPETNKIRLPGVV